MNPFDEIAVEEAILIEAAADVQTDTEPLTVAKLLKAVVKAGALLVRS